MAKLNAVFRNYGSATASTALISASHFLLQLAVLRALGAAEFGLVAFVMTLIQLGTGLCNAFIAAPYAVVVARVEKDSPVVASFFLISLLNAALVAALTAAAVMTLAGGDAAVAGLFAFASAFFSIRLFGRTEAYTQQAPLLASLSDVAYSLAILLGLAVLWFGKFSLEGVALVFVIASAVSLVPFGPSFLRKHAIRHGMDALTAYLPVWREHARWAVIGLITTEATTNAHSYIVTTIAGPSGFAPLAAAMLFLRPIGVCIVSLTQLERPVLAKALSSGTLADVQDITRRFTAVLVAITLLTVLFAAAVFRFTPSLVFKPGLDAQDVMTATAIWSATMLVSCVLTPRSVLLQAAGLFRGLAKASIRSCWVTILAVLVLAYLAGPVFSALGILAGQIIMAIAIVNHARPILSGMGEPFAKAMPIR